MRAPEPRLDLAAYDFEYPESLVAREPAAPRDASRLLVLEGDAPPRHLRFRELGSCLRPGDCLVLNRSKVLPARLLAEKPGGGRAEILLVSALGAGSWSALARRLKVGSLLRFSEGLQARIERLDEEGLWRLKFSQEDILPYLRRRGLPPLPPYILKRREPGREEADAERYQTVYAREEGSIAAPTAGLHFTPALLGALRTLGARTAEIILHVGRGTFKPVLAPDVREHVMLPESYRVPPETLRAIEETRRGGGRVIAVGTSAARVLETLARGGPPEGESSLFLHPAERFLGVDALLTNFHLPRSTPLLLAAAFAGRERLLAAYREAFGLGYRLFSYGDAMFITEAMSNESSERWAHGS